MDSLVPVGVLDSEGADELRKDNWETPDHVFKHWNDKFHFILDAAANRTNHKCENWFGPGGIEEDALSANWESWYRKGNIWLNPPYSRGIQRQFVERAIDHWYCSGCSNTCVMLLPADTSTKLFHEVVWGKGFRVEFLRGRIRFKGATGSPKFGNMVVIL